MNTSEDGYRLIQLFEGCKLEAYQPVPGGNWTIGWGNEGKLYDGRPIVEGMTISQQEADDDFAFTMYNEIDPLVNAYMNPQNQDEFDACASWVYNIRHDKLRKLEYTLPKLVNLADRSPDTIDQIIDFWLKYYRTPGAENGLYRRRIIEVCKFLGLPWNAPAVLGMVRTISAGADPEPVFQMAEAIYDQMDADNQTAALNNAQLEKLGGTPEQPVPKGMPSVKPKKVKAVETPKLDATHEKEVVPMEQSGTHKNLSNADTGKEIVVTGGIVSTGVMATVPVMDRVAKFIEGTKPETIYMTVGLGLGLFMVIGGVRWWWGRMGAYRERQNTTRVKV